VTIDQTAQDRLRTELLTSGLSDWVSLAEVQQIVSHYHLAETDVERQELAMRTIRSLLEDGLMQLGDLPGPNDKAFPAWEPVESALMRLHDRFVHHYADPKSWDYSIWLGITDAGEQVAKASRRHGPRT
jgi:hypothetical protein